MDHLQQFNWRDAISVKNEHKVKTKCISNLMDLCFIFVLCDYFIEQNGIQIKLVLIIFNRTGFKLNNVNLCDSVNG